MASKARQNAQLNGGIGYHYPWESAFSGAEVSPNTCSSTDPKCLWNHYYVTAGISYAIRMYHSMTRDRDYMVNTIYAGCDVSREVARFLANQAIYNPAHGRYDMNGITGPDEFHPNVNNNAFTLCAASLAIHWARYYSCICQRNERDEIPDEYIQKALYLNLPYDNVKRMHYQHEGFDASKDAPIKQADTIMLNYPLNWNYSADIMKNDLQYYELLITDRTPAMTWSWFTIGWKWVNEQSKMRSYFLKSYQDYIIQPFKIWTEYTERNPTDQAVGNVNFLPGMGAFLQSVIYGFAGFRVRPDRLEVFNPIPPPGATTITLTNFQYLGTNMTFTIAADKTTLKVTSTNVVLPLILRRNQTAAVEESLTAGATITIDKATSNGFFIYPSIAETCEHPRDYIYMPWGYSPWVQAAPPRFCRLTAAVKLFVLLLVVGGVVSRF
jgi:trehalose/maltose hydrolase-like predicted phosphorylase